jgi:hypothetical protein
MQELTSEHAPQDLGGNQWETLPALSEYKDARGNKIDIGDSVRLSDAGKAYFLEDPRWLRMNQPQGSDDEVVEQQAKEETIIQYRGKVVGFSDEGGVESVNIDLYTEKSDKPSQFANFFDEIDPHYLIVDTKS